MARKRRQGRGSADNRPFFTRVTDPIISALRRITGCSSNFGIADSRLPVAFALAAAVVFGLLALPSTAEAQRPRLNLQAGPHSQHASTEHGSPTFRFQVAASGTVQELKHFCGRGSGSSVLGNPCGSTEVSDNAVKLEFDVEWQSFDDYGLQRYGGYPVYTKTALVSQDAVNNTNMVIGQSPWVWDRTVNGIPRDDQRPLRATVTMTVIDTTKARAGSTTTHQLVLNPTIAILTQGISATEGTDTHMEFPVAMTPPPLEPVTVDYATKDFSATAGSDYTATSGTLTFAAGETAKTIRVPITNDAVSDSGELLGMVFSNPTGAARMILLGSGESQSVVEALGQILNDEPGADDLPVVTITSESGSIAEGSDAVFTLTRTGETDEALTVGLGVAETGAMLSDSPPTSATFATGEAETELRVATVGDDADEDDSTLTMTLTSGETYRLGTNNQMASSVTVLDDDAATLPGGTVAVAGTTIWAADMTVTDYGNGSIGAGTADLLANQRSIKGLQARHLYYHTSERKLRMAFTSTLATGSLTLAAGNVKLAFPEGRSGDSSFTWDDVAVDWSDGQTFEARVVSGSKDAVEAPDPTLKTLTVSDATLSPAFDADTVAYTATVAAATARVTLSGTLNDDDASLAYTPSTDADSSTAGHQVDVAVGDTTATITVTAADGNTTRAYRVVVKRPTPEVETSTPTLSIAGGSGTEGADSAISFTVSLDEAATDTVTVDYATSDGTATAGSDYTSTSGTLTFDAGTTSKTISVSIADDETDESDETFTVTLSNASGADLGTSTATGTITNRAVVVETTATLSIAGGSGTEGDDDDIDFTVTLNESASETVTVDYATSDGTADSGGDYTAKSGTLSFSAGTTSKTISVSIENDVENESDETFTVTLSNASGADVGTSTATGTIRNRRVEPLTASFSGMPSEHDGSSFTFELQFSENPEVSFRTLKNHAFTVDEGDVTRAQRKNPQSADKNKAWTITVEPDGNDTISITLPATTSCSSNRAICTDDGRKLSHSTSATVAGPPSISVADATVTEAAGAVLAFTVSLSRSSGSNVTVDYATSDGTATAGADYTATSGTLTISAGSTSATVDVSVLDDSHDDGGETLTLTLSNAANGTLGDSTATGTIENSDPLPKALMARFGRTAAVHIVEQVEERVNAPRQPGFDGRLAGRQVNANMGRDFALNFLQQLGGGAGYTPMGTRQPMHGPGGATTGAAAMGHAGGAPVNGGGLTPMGAGGMQPMQPGHGPDGMGMSLGHGSLLTGSGFALNRVTKTGGILSFWSRSAQSQFYGQDGALALNGDVRTSMFGADYSKGRMVTGVSLSHSRGLGSYAGVDNGRVTSAVTGLYPWIGYKASERVTVWTVAGYGAGGLLLNPGAGTPVETGLSMAMAAGGGRGQILGGGEGFGLAFKADALWVGTRTDESDGPNGRLRGTSAAVNRLRTALEGSQSMELGGRIALTPSVEVGIRQDGGDAERGTGMDVGAGLVFADAVTGLSVDVRIRTLVVHQAEGYAERGVSISVSYNPTPSTPLGFSARVSPAWGSDAMSGAQALWGRESMAGMSHDPLMNGGGQRLDTEVGYGLPIGSRLVGTPRAGVRTSEYGRDYRIGYGMQVLEQGRLNLQLGVDAERRESPIFHQQEQSGGTDQRVLGHATVQW